MDEHATPRKVLEEVLNLIRRTGKPRLRWTVGETVSARSVLRNQNWKAVARDISEWQRLIEEANTHPGM